MRNLSDAERSQTCGGDPEAPILYPPSQATAEIERILDSLVHVYQRPGTY
jgi:hypothetical protein